MVSFFFEGANLFNQDTKTYGLQVIYSDNIIFFNNYVATINQGTLDKDSYVSNVKGLTVNGQKNACYIQKSLFFVYPNYLFNNSLDELYSLNYTMKYDLSNFTSFEIELINWKPIIYENTTIGGSIRLSSYDILWNDKIQGFSLTQNYGFGSRYYDFGNGNIIFANSFTIYKNKPDPFTQIQSFITINGDVGKYKNINSGFIKNQTINSKRIQIFFYTES